MSGLFGCMVVEGLCGEGGVGFVNGLGAPDFVTLKSVIL